MLIIEMYSNCDFQFSQFTKSTCTRQDLEQCQDQNAENQDSDNWWDSVRWISRLENADLEHWEVSRWRILIFTFHQICLCQTRCWKVKISSYCYSRIYWNSRMDILKLQNGNTQCWTLESNSIATVHFHSSSNLPVSNKRLKIEKIRLLKIKILKTICTLCVYYDRGDKTDAEHGL